MVQIEGTYTRVSAENYDQFLRALGVDLIVRKLTAFSYPVMTVEKSIGSLSNQVRA